MEFCIYMSKSQQANKSEVLLREYTKLSAAHQTILHVKALLYRLPGKNKFFGDFKKC